MKTKIIQSLRDLQLQMPAIIQQYGSDNNLTQIALANPIVALERAGFQFTQSAKEEIENHVRFGHEGSVRINSLQQSIRQFIGKETDFNNAGQLADVLIQILPNDQNDPTAQTKSQKKSNYKPIGNLTRDSLLQILLTPPKKVKADWQDDLLPLENTHPVFPLLIEFRKMQASHPAFASPEKIPAIEEKLKTLPLKNVVFTLQRNKNNLDSNQV